MRAVLKLLPEAFIDIVSHRLHLRRGRLSGLAAILTAVFAICLGAPERAGAQLHAQFAAAQSMVPSSNLSYPYRVAVDANGNVYISDTQANEVLKETWSPATQSTVTSGLNNPEAIAIDGAGNVYIADSGNNRILMESWQNGS